MNRRLGRGPGGGVEHEGLLRRGHFRSSLLTPRAGAPQSGQTYVRTPSTTRVGSVLKREPGAAGPERRAARPVERGTVPRADEPAVAALQRPPQVGAHVRCGPGETVDVVNGAPGSQPEDGRSAYAELTH